MTPVRLLRRAAAALLLLATTVAAAPSKIERAPDFVRRVNAAIDRGVEWLRKSQAPDGSFAEFPTFPGGTTAMAYHALRVCGVPKDDPVTTRAWTAMRRRYRKIDLRTYSAAVYLLGIASHGEPATKAKDDRDVKLSAEDKSWAEEIAKLLVAARGKDGWWGYECVPDGTFAIPGDVIAYGTPYSDLSNTQYALLGLKHAARCGVAVDPDVWRDALSRLLESQEPTGPAVRRRTASSMDPRSTSARIEDHARGWAYRWPLELAPGKRVDPAMTAGGVSSVVVCRSELMGTKEMTPALDVGSERAVWDGLAWLGLEWKAKPAPPMKPEELPRALRGLAESGARHGGPDCYACYGVERAGVLAGVDWMAELDWYGEGAKLLCQTQDEAGSWTGPGGSFVVDDMAGAERARRVADTCFALLFLKRGTSPVRLGAVTANDEADVDFAAGGKAKGAEFDAFLDEVLVKWRCAQDEGARKRLFDGATALGPRIVEPLLVRMDAPDVEKRAAAHALLARATGLDFGWFADATPQLREAAVEKWQMWWIGAKAKCVYDAQAKRLVVP